MIKVPHWLPVGQTIPWLEELGDPRFRVPGNYAPKMKIPEAEKTPEQKSAEGAQRVFEEMGRVNPRAPRPEMIPPGRSDYLQQFLEEGEEQKPGTREIQLRRVQEQTMREFNLRFRHMDGIQPVANFVGQQPSKNVRDLRDPLVAAKHNARELFKFERARSDPVATDDENARDAMRKVQKVREAVAKEQTEQTLRRARTP